MSIDFDQIILSANESSLKLWLEGTASLTVPARGINDFQYDRATIAHSYGSDDLEISVGFKNFFTDETAFSPFFASGGTYFIAWLDSTNLYIEAGDATAGVAQPDPLPFTCQYRLFIP